MDRDKFIFWQLLDQGSSLHVAERIYLSMKYGRTVVANFEINLDKIKRSKGNYIYLDNVEITPDRLMQIGSDHVKKYGRREDSILLVIDECQILLIRVSGNLVVVLNG